MKHLFLSLFALFFALGLPMQEAEAKRFGGGKSSGFQRDNISQRQATPQRNADAPAQQGTNGAAAGQAGKRSWMGPIAGIAAGLGLAALASHLGLGEEFANFLLIALAVMAAIFLFKWLTRGRAQAQTAPRHAMQYAGAGAGSGTGTGNMQPPASPLPGSVAAASTAQADNADNTLPAGFDAEGFVRQAKLNFLRMQAAYDAGNLDDIREFTSPEMFAEIKLQLAERGDAAQQTDVLNLNADVLEAVEEANRYVVSVRFHGLIREEQAVPATDFNEIWHMTRPTQGKQGWVVAGIQQAQ
jgi:predicted lipid-binding transport protein (Tim44 family)